MGLKSAVISKPSTVAEIEAQLACAQQLPHLGSYEWDVETDHVIRSAEPYGVSGLSPDEFRSGFEDYLERVHIEDQAFTRMAIEEGKRQGRPFDFEHRIVRPDGEIRVLRSQGEWITQDGHPATLLCIVQDITERKAAEARLRSLSEALASELKERTRTEQEVKALNARLIRAQEDERARLARELHDDISQQIAVLSIATTKFRKTIPPDSSAAQQESETIQAKLVSLAESIRRVSHNLHPIVLQHAGLPAALSRYGSELGALAGIKVALQIHGSVQRTPPDVALSVYRIVQESLQNVIKHARVTEAEVLLEVRDDVLSVTISDKGVGMDLSRPGGHIGLGLLSIRERARLVNGSMELESRPQQGTTLTVRVPLTPRAE